VRSYLRVSVCGTVGGVGGKVDRRGGGGLCLPPGTHSNLQVSRAIALCTWPCNAAMGLLTQRN
jgi:hypothetical protein